MMGDSKMKRQTVLLFAALIVMAVCISGCGFYSGSTEEDVIAENEKLLEEVDKLPVVPDSAGEDPIESDIHNQEDYREAVAAALEYFNNFEGCYMSEIKYAGDDETKAEAEYQKCDPKDVIVLISTFETGDNGGDGSLEPNKTYSDYKWIIMRDEDGTWKHKDHGYG